ncbi:hypothetical protein ACIQOV_03315 [Kitasatospora sp. NPDC091257]
MELHVEGPDGARALEVKLWFAETGPCGNQRQVAWTIVMLWDYCSCG